MGYLNAKEIEKNARAEAETQRLYHNISRAVCDMINSKWGGKKINKRISYDAEKAISEAIDRNEGVFEVRYDTSHGMYHLEIKHVYEPLSTSYGKLKDFEMSMLICYKENTFIGANRVEEHNRCYLVGNEREARILGSIDDVQKSVELYNRAIGTLESIQRNFDNVYPFSSYFDFKASRKDKTK